MRWAAAWSLLLAACDGGEWIGMDEQPLDARCSVRVDGTGVVDVETNYLPGVIRCENGSADFEALKALAVSARSVLYYTLAREDSIGDGTGTQVYSCGTREVTELHRRAVEETSGEVLRYSGTQVYGFYVAGAIGEPPGCDPGRDPTSTEHYVTYNEGRSGGDVRQTTLGWVDPANDANRGCLSQNGSHCQAEAGRDYRSILRFYYGEDIGLVRAEGACVTPPMPDAGMEAPDAGLPDTGPAMTSDAGAGFDAGGGDAIRGGCSTTSPSGLAPFFWAILLLGLLHRRTARVTRRARGGREGS